MYEVAHYLITPVATYDNLSLNIFFLPHFDRFCSLFIQNESHFMEVKSLSPPLLVIGWNTPLLLID